MDQVLCEKSGKSGIVALVGPANAGKSTLLNSILADKVSIVSTKPHTTRNRIVGVKTLPDSQLVFFDTPGFALNIRKGQLKRYLIEALRSAAEEVDAVVLVLDGAQLSKIADLSNVLSGLRDSKVREPDVVVLNKMDKLDREGILPLIAKFHQSLENEHLKKMPEIVPMSALKDNGVDELVRTLLNIVPEGPFLYPADQITDQAESFFISEIIREKVFERTRQEIPYSVAVEVIQTKETPDMLHIYANIFVEKPNQKSIVIGSHARALKAIGIAAREELEKIFDVRINLQLYVKVEEDWSQSDKGLRKVGY